MPKSDEQVLPGPLKPVNTKEEREVFRYKPPTRHRMVLQRRLLQVEDWIAKQGLVYRDEVLTYIMHSFNMDPHEAGKVYKAVENDFRRIGKVYED